MKKGFIFTVMLVSVLALGYSQSALSGTYRYSTNAYITFTSNSFTGSWNATSPISGTYSVSGSRITLNITGGPKSPDTWGWTIVDANTLRDQDGDRWNKEGTGSSSSVQVPAQPPISWNVNNVAGWIEAVNGIRSGGNNKAHNIIITGTVLIPITPESELTFGNVTGITISIDGNGSISRSGGTSGNLLRVGSRQTVILKNLMFQGGDITTEGILRMEGTATVSGCGVSVINSGTFIMQDNASISGNSNGRGVYVSNNGSFTMQDNASVKGNVGGVSVYGNGIFTMKNNALISDNTTSGSGGGVSVGGGKFTMESGTISGNTTNGSYSDRKGGAGVYVSRGTFVMLGGEISNNTDRGNGQLNGGGGVYVTNDGTFTMQGNAMITGNTTQDMGSGGGVYLGFSGNEGRGTFIMLGGTISGNTASRSGGGVSVGGTSNLWGWGGSANKMFTMRGGSISGNLAGSNGGGVSLGSGAPLSFIMEGGTISGNRAGGDGGGVYGENFNKTGGTIYGNDANPSNLCNIASNRGHAIFSGNNWRNATAGATMNLGSYGFWLNEEDQATVQHNQGVEYCNKGDYDLAIAAFTEAIRLNPNYALSYRWRGYTYGEKGDYDREIADLNQAIRLDPNDATAYNNRGWAYNKKNDYDHAIADLNQAIRLDPNDKIAYGNRSNAYYDKGDYDMAIADYNQLIRINPNDAIAYNNRGNAYNRKGDYDRAIADLNQAIRLDPNLANPYRHRGFAYMQKGNLTQARTDVNKALQLNPDYKDAQTLSAELLQKGY